MIDYHLHSHISGDCDTPMREQAAAAAAKELKEICFTEHIDIDFPSYTPEQCVVDYDAYNAALTEVRADFPKMRIQKGIEAGIEAAHTQQVQQLIEGRDIDFVIGSVHLIDRLDPYNPEFWDKWKQKAAFVRYAEALIESANACSFYNVIGHIGYIGKFCPHDDRMYRYSEHAEATDELLRIVIASGKGIEVNTGGLRMTPSTMPETDILRRYHELGGEIITVGSDAHKSEHVGLAVFETLETLKEIGFKYVCTFSKREPQFVPIP